VAKYYNTAGINKWMRSGVGSWRDHNWAKHVAGLAEMRSEYEILVGKPKTKRT